MKARPVLIRTNGRCLINNDCNTLINITEWMLPNDQWSLVVTVMVDVD